jgi:hypothetical protein
MVSPIFRESSGRMGTVSDSGVNVIYRAYFHASESFMTTVKDDVSTFRWELVAPYIQALNEGLEKSFGDIELTPARLQLTKSEHDDFFTIVLAYKLGSDLRNKNEINRHRYFFSKICYENNLGFICLNSYQTHLNIGTWDEKHINEAPFVSYDKKRTLNFFKEELPKLMEKYKDSLKEESKSPSNERKKEDESASNATATPSSEKSSEKTSSPSPKKKAVKRKSSKIEKSPSTSPANENPAPKEEGGVIANGSESPPPKEEKVNNGIADENRSPEPKAPASADATVQNDTVIEGEA